MSAAARLGEVCVDGEGGRAADVVDQIVRVEPAGTTTVPVTGPYFVFDPRRAPDGVTLAWPGELLSRRPPPGRGHRRGPHTSRTVGMIIGRRR